MAIEFEALALNGHHCPIWAIDIMIALVSRRIKCAIQASGKDHTANRKMVSYIS